MNPPGQHDTDFYSWTQEQAALLRALPRETYLLDVENIAEEIADLGRSEINQITNLLMQTLFHTIKVAADSDGPTASNSVSEADNFQRQALVVYSPGLKGRLDLPKMWKLAKTGANNALAEFNIAVRSLPDDCPFSLDQLLDADFSPREAATVVTAAFQATPTRRR